MNFDWTPAEMEVKRKVADLLKDTPKQELQRLEEADLPELKEITGRYLSRLAETGYLSLGMGPGARAQTMALMAAQEELAGASGSLFLAAETTARLFGGLVAGFGTGDTAREIVTSLQKGELVGAVALSEPEPDVVDESRQSDPGWNTLGTADADQFIVTGKKSFVTNGPIADMIAVIGEAQGKSAVFLVDPQSPGVKLGSRLHTLGYNGLAVSRMELSAVRVPKDRVLGPFEDDTPIEFLRLIQDLVLTMASVGLLQRTVAASKDYAQSRLRGGRPIFQHQEIRFKLAEMLTLSQTAQLMSFRAGWFYSISDREAPVLLRCAKVFSAESAEQVATMGMQIMAGEGYLWNNPIQQAYRESKYTGIAGTTSEVARMFIADDLLRRYRV